MTSRLAALAFTAVATVALLAGSVGPAAVQAPVASAARTVA
jgi:hypothetical protein